ncbi:unnamed protein product [Closterium sp. Naga37s-1]|nr:unnamed protein product [Closterium sp. Naga37s-1]
MLRNRYKNLPTSLHPVSPQKFLQVRVQCEPAGKLVRVQCEPAGKLVIAGEPEQPDNPWGVTPFKKTADTQGRRCGDLAPATAAASSAAAAGGIEARAGPQQGLAAGHAALMQQHANPLPRQQQAQPQVPFQVQSQVQLAQQQMQPTRTKEGSADVDMVGGADRGEGLRDGKDGNVSVNKPNYTTESQNGMPQLLQQPQQGKQVERETGTNDMKIGMAVTAAS